MTAPADRRTSAALATAFALGLLLRAPWLGAMPTPAGDEGNWALLGLRLHEGVDAGLPADAAFVTTAFGRLLALAFDLGGPSWASARAVPVAAVLASMVALVWLAGPLGWRRAGAFVALVLAVHPWSVAWSRTVSVPYALSLGTAVVGPLAWLDALRARSAWRMLVASQLLGLGMHFSPLAVVPIAACALGSFGPERPRGWGLLAALSGALHVAPVVAGALSALRVGRQAPSVTEPLASRLASMTRMMLGDLAGTSTAAHFAGCPRGVALAGAALAAAFAVYVVARGRHPLTRFAARYLALAFVGLPLLLVPGRAWHMPVVDADRYGFVLVAPLALAVGGLAMEGARSRAVAAACVLWLAGVTAGVAHHFVRGGGGDLGLPAAGGGRYRGWQVPRERAPLPDLLRDEALRAAGGETATVAYGDYAFHALRFSIAAARAAPGLTHALRTTGFPSGRRVFFVTWGEGAFAPGYEPAGVPEENRRLRERLMREGAVRLRTFVMADGTTLCELWSTRAPAMPRALRSRQ